MASDLSERGIGFQAFGFAVVGFSSVALLHIFSDSNFWLYKVFQIAVTQLHWAFLVPLAALFDWGRKMFETRQAIRDAALQSRIQTGVNQVLDERIGQALKGERKRIRESVEKSDLPEPVKQQILKNLEK